MDKICTRIINQNIRNVELGEPLTLPLKQLNTDCRFRNFYNQFCNIKEGLEPDTDIKYLERKAKMREYRQKPEVKAKRREYRQKPEVKAKRREYNRKKFKIPKSRWRIK